MSPVRLITWIAVAIPALVVPIASLACSGSAHIELREAGVYALDQEDIVVAQPRLGDCRSDELALSWRGHEVPLRVVGDRDGKFAPGAHIEWGSAAWSVELVRHLHPGQCIHLVGGAGDTRAPPSRYRCWRRHSGTSRAARSLRTAE
jgi:hypothetical protein